MPFLRPKLSTKKYLPLVIPCVIIAPSKSNGSEGLFSLFTSISACFCSQLPVNTCSFYSLTSTYKPLSRLKPTSKVFKVYPTPKVNSTFTKVNPTPTDFKINPISVVKSIPTNLEVNPTPIATPTAKIIPSFCSQTDTYMYS